MRTSPREKKIQLANASPTSPASAIRGFFEGSVPTPRARRARRTPVYPPSLTGFRPFSSDTSLRRRDRGGRGSGADVSAGEARARGGGKNREGARGEDARASDDESEHSARASSPRDRASTRARVDDLFDRART